MGLTRDWARQTARAAGVSLIAPVALLGAAAVVAAGGGLGGLGSLAQVASGPSLAPTDLTPAPRSRSLGRAQVVALELGGNRGARGAIPAAPGAAPAGSTSPDSSVGAPGGREVALSPGAPQSGAGPKTPSAESGGQGSAPSAAAPVPQLGAPPAAPAPANPVGDAVAVPRDLGESLPAPVGPTVGNTADGILGPRR